MCNAGREAWHRVDPQSTAVKPRSHWKYGWHRLGVSTAQIQGEGPGTTLPAPNPAAPASSPRPDSCPRWIERPRVRPQRREPPASALAAPPARLELHGTPATALPPPPRNQVSGCQETPGYRGCRLQAARRSGVWVRGTSPWSHCQVLGQGPRPSPAGPTTSRALSEYLQNERMIADTGSLSLRYCLYF